MGSMIPEEMKLICTVYAKEFQDTGKIADYR